LDLARDVQKKATQILELNRVRYHAGSASEADESKAEAAKLEADQSVALAKQGVEVNRFALGFFLGVRGRFPDFEVDEDLPRYTVPSALASLAPEALLKKAFEQRPDLKAIEQQRLHAESALALARRQIVPDFSLVLAYTQMGTGGVGTNAPLQPPTVGVALQFGLPVFYQQQGEVQKALADLRSQEAQRAKAEADITSDVATAYTNFITSRELVERMQARLLDRAARTRNLVAIQYEKGAASLLELLDAERTYIAVNQEYLQDLANYWIALFQLDQAIGGNLVESSP
jgi:cobalt-zinc-cadmium efflux system outer membrane protein